MFLIFGFALAFGFGHSSDASASNAITYFVAFTIAAAIGRATLDAGNPVAAEPDHSHC